MERREYIRVWQGAGCKKSDTFSICACHPCAGAMLIFSVSFQFYRMRQVLPCSENTGNSISFVRRGPRRWQPQPVQMSSDVARVTFVISWMAQLAAQSAVNRKVESSSLSLGDFLLPLPVVAAAGSLLLATPPQLLVVPIPTRTKNKS